MNLNSVFAGIFGLGVGVIIADSRKIYADGGKVKTKSITVYTFDELSDEAKSRAIEDERDKRYKGENDYAEWAIDNDYLFEPKHDELVKLFGEDFYEKLNKGEKYKDSPLIANTRKGISFDTERDRHLYASEAMNVRNDAYFLKWLGIPEDMNVSYTITSTSGRYPDTVIEFESNDEPFTPGGEKIIEAAQEKFADHMSDVLNNIESSINEMYSDEVIAEDLEANEYEFMEDGRRSEFKDGGSVYAKGGEVASSFFDDNPSKTHTANIHVVKDGQEIKIYSYDTVIAKRKIGEKTIELNTKKYSNTTTKLQNMLKKEASEKGFSLHERGEF